MKCPACGQQMVTQNFGVDVDVCVNGCHGIWFDQGELRRLDEKDEGAAAAIEAALRSPRDNQGRRGPLTCPKCGIPMHTHKYDEAREVNVDECYSCGGFFLDSGELTEIRDNHMDDAEVNAYAEQLMNAMPQYTEAKSELADEKERVEKRAEAVDHLTRFLRASYWEKSFH